MEGKKIEEEAVCIILYRKGEFKEGVDGFVAEENPPARNIYIVIYLEL